MIWVGDTIQETDLNANANIRRNIGEADLHCAKRDIKTIMTYGIKQRKKVRERNHSSKCDGDKDERSIAEINIQCCSKSSGHD